MLHETQGGNRWHLLEPRTSGRSYFRLASNEGDVWIVLLSLGSYLRWLLFIQDADGWLYRSLFASIFVASSFVLRSMTFVTLSLRYRPPTIATEEESFYGSAASQKHRSCEIGK